MKRVAFGVVIVAAVVLMIAPPATHATSITFNIAASCVASPSPCGGLHIFSSTSATAFNIRIGSVTIAGAPTASANGTFAVTSNLPFLGGNGDLVFNSSTNSISITGAIASLGVGQQVLMNSTGAFSSFNVVAFTPTSGQITASGPDLKSPNLLAAIGLATNTQFNFFGFVIGYSTSGSGPTMGYDVINGGVLNQTPEPGTLTLFGSGLLSVAALLRRKRLIPV